MFVDLELAKSEVRFWALNEKTFTKAITVGLDTDNDVNRCMFITDTTCIPGTWREEATEYSDVVCNECESGKYTDTNNADTCITHIEKNCPEGMGFEEGNAPSKTQDGFCTICEDGYWSTSDELICNIKNSCEGDNEYLSSRNLSRPPTLINFSSRLESETSRVYPSQRSSLAASNASNVDENSSTGLNVPSSISFI